MQDIAEENNKKPYIHLTIWNKKYQNKIKIAYHKIQVQHTTSILKSHTKQEILLQGDNQTYDNDQFYKIGIVVLQTAQDGSNILKFCPIFNENYSQMGFHIIIGGSAYLQNRIDKYQLKPGVIFRLGHTQYVVAETRNNQTTQWVKQSDTNVYKCPQRISNTTQELINQQKRQQLKCRICFSDLETPENPLITPCLCKSSSHFSCLRRWIKTRMKRKVKNFVTSYELSKNECEVCKSSLPKMVEIDGKQFEMESINRPQMPYIIIQDLNVKNQGNAGRYLHLGHFSSNQQIKIGRGQNCQIQSDHHTISRLHAKIIFKDDRFYIQDLGSSYGTSIKMTGQCMVKSKALNVKYGAITFGFKLHNPSEQKMQMMVQECKNNDKYQ